MFKISIVETQSQRRLVVEGQLIAPWATEVENAWRGAAEELNGKKLVIDLANVTVISREGEQVLLRLMRDGARFTCRGVLLKHVLKQLARRCRCNAQVDVDLDQAQTTNH
jgi:anti-anti-sigma regulatory factor